MRLERSSLEVQEILHFFWGWLHLGLEEAMGTIGERGLVSHSRSQHLYINTGKHRQEYRHGFSLADTSVTKNTKLTLLWIKESYRGALLVLILVPCLFTDKEKDKNMSYFPKMGLFLAHCFCGRYCRTVF